MQSSTITHIVVLFNQVDNIGGVIGQFPSRGGLNDFSQLLVDGELVLGDSKNDAHRLRSELGRDLRHTGVVLVGALCVQVVAHVAVAVIGKNNAAKLQQQQQ